MKIELNINGIKPLDIKKGATPLGIINDLQIKGNKRPLAAHFNGSLIDLTLPLSKGGKLEFLTFDSEEGRSVYWHSTSHIMAQAVLRLFPDTKLAIGPSISEGFYYDFYTERNFSIDDLEQVEKEMATIISENHPFERMVMSKEEAKSLFAESGSTFKLELLEELDGEISLYKSGEFIDLCRGPHLPSAGYVKAFKLLSVSGSYWRGDERRENLQRIYGISFENRKELKAYLHRIEEAKERDHRKLGKELDLFSISEKAGSGFILWHPKGAALRRVIEDFWKEEHIKHGYQLVITPHIAKAELWKISGHYDFYVENMYTFHKDDEEFVVKPMNCPGHILIYQSKMHSYRDLPIRYAEMGTVVRNELSGVLQGMLRSREFTIDDGHIFCTPEQMDDEILGVLRFARSMAETFGFQKLQYDLSVREPGCSDKYAGCDEDWQKAEQSLIRALEAENLDYKRMEGEAVFYGPKIDVKVFDALGRPWQGPTIQFDFNLPGRFNVTYIGKDGDPHNVFIIHRTVFGSLERFIGSLIEHYKGDFPVWLAPVQVRVLTITDKSRAYAEQVSNALLSHGIRVELDGRNEKINLKVREAEKEKIPYMAVVGEREEKEHTLSLRERHRKNRGAITLNSLLDELREKCDSRTLT